MAFRTRKRFSSGRSRRKPTQWITNLWTGNATSSVTAATSTAFTLVSMGTSQVTIGGDNFVMGQRLTVLRIVGDLVLENTNTTTQCFYSWGIIAVDEVNLTPDNFDPTVQNNADKSWLYFKHGRMMPLVNATIDTSNQTHLPHGSHFDVRVKRVLRPDTRLQLMLVASTTCNAQLNARTLIARLA